MGIYPAVDVPASVSRVMNEIITPQQKENALMFRRLVSLYLENRDLILMGGYSPGQDPDLDLAAQLWPQLMDHVQQSLNEKSSFDESVAGLQGLFNGAV